MLILLKRKSGLFKNQLGELLISTTRGQRVIFPGIWFQLKIENFDTSWLIEFFICRKQFNESYSVWNRVSYARFHSKFERFNFAMSWTNQDSTYKYSYFRGDYQVTIMYGDLNGNMLGVRGKIEISKAWL